MSNTHGFEILIRKKKWAVSSKGNGSSQATTNPLPFGSPIQGLRQATYANTHPWNPTKPLLIVEHRYTLFVTHQSYPWRPHPHAKLPCSEICTEEAMQTSLSFDPHSREALQYASHCIHLSIATAAVNQPNEWTEH